MKVIKHLSRFIILFAMFGVFALSSWGALNVCPGDTISNLDGATSSSSQTIAANLPANTTHYYSFTPSVSGTIQVDSAMSSAYANSLYIKDGCDLVLWANISDSDNKSSPAIEVLANKQIVIAFQRRHTTSKNYTLEFNFIYIPPAPPIMNNIPNQTANVNTSFTLNLSDYVTPTNGDVITDYTLTGSLPAWLSFNSGTLSGKPTQTASAITFSATATDKDGISNPKSFTLTVEPQITETTGGRDFTERTKENIFGDVRVVGNTVLCELNSAKTACVESANNVSNNSVNLQRAPLSYSTLVIPAGATIESARIYWQGRKAESSSWDSSSKAKAGEIGIRKGNSGAFTTLIADIKDFDTTANIPIYSASADALSIVNGSGRYYIDTADFYTITGKTSDGLGTYGAWTLVVIYKDPNEENIRNITIFDGYRKVISGNSNNVNVSVSGFLSPSAGPVDSKVYVFAGEGDKYLDKTGDVIKMAGATYNTVLQTLGTFDSRVDVDGDRSPNLVNNNGIDIHKYDTGTSGRDIITNKETGANFQFTSDQDTYFPSLIVFSTQLYVPDVCYLEEVSFNNQPITGTNLPEKGENVEYTVEITNKNNELAKGVLIEKIFDKPDEIKYVAGSVNITVGEGTAEYSNDTDTMKLFLGSGAISGVGGTIEKGQISEFKYLAEVGDQNASQNRYLVSYRNDVLDVTFSGIEIRKCVDFNNSFGVYFPVIGKYNTVRSGAVDVEHGDTDPVDPLDEKNALYTQIVGKSFVVDVISLNSDNITPMNSNEDVDLTIVELPLSGDCSEATDLLSINYPINISEKKYERATVTANKASRNAVFKMQTASAPPVCSRDSFAIRPATYTIDANPTEPLVGNRKYQFTFVATHHESSTIASENYNQIVHNMLDKNATTQLIVPAGCDSLDTTAKYTNVAIPFANGSVVAEVLYPNIGEVEFKLSDKEWTLVDSDKGDCIEDSAQNTSDGSGRVGCMTQGSKTFNFVPEKFTSELLLGNGSNDKSFTYISSEREISAPLTLKITAMLHPETTGEANAATNYTKDCFSSDINTTISLIPNQALSNGTNTQARIRFFDDLALTSTLINQNLNTATFQTIQDKFVAGISDVNISINFQRNLTLADNPFSIAKNDFNITQVVDINGITGSDFNRADDMNATFVYGRTNASKQRYGANGGPANIYFEVYCFDKGIDTCNKTLLPNGVNSRKINDRRWYINDNHDSLSDGNVTLVMQKGGLNTSADIVTATDNPTGNPSTTTIQYSGNGGYPYRTTMQNEASPWLIYDENDPTSTRNEFQVEFNNAGEWSGEHETETTTKKDNINTNTNRRVIW